MNKRGKIKEKWSTEEEELLKELYADYKHKIDSISKILGRSKHSIMSKTRKLGIKKVTIRDVQVQENQKICSRCFEIKTLDKFYKNRNKPQGVESYCSNCYAELRNKALIRKAEKKLMQEENEKQEFINKNEHTTFKCPTCKRYLKIQDFSVYKSEGRFRKAGICKKCNAKLSKESQYRRYAELGHR